MRVFRGAAAVLLAVASLHAESFVGKAVGISDGDTIKVMHNGKAERIRLWGIGRRCIRLSEHAPSSSPAIWFSARMSRWRSGMWTGIIGQLAK